MTRPGPQSRMGTGAVRRSRPRQRSHPWDAAVSIPIWRSCPIEPQSGILEPGVRYFVLQLERLGARTTFSCEGHPAGFYIIFHAPEAIARKIAGCCGLAVEVDIHGGWRLAPYSVHGTERRRVEGLRSAAMAWERGLGGLDITAAQGWPADKPFDPKRAHDGR